MSSKTIKVILYVLHIGRAPNPWIQERLNRELSTREYLNQEQWRELCCGTYGVSGAVAEFSYHKFGWYSGLDIGYVRPSDLLLKDLHWNEITWPDWEFDYFEDVDRWFGVDLVPVWEEPHEYTTVGNLMMTLHNLLLK